MQLSPMGSRAQTRREPVGNTWQKSETNWLTCYDGVPIRVRVGRENRLYIFGTYAILRHPVKALERWIADIVVPYTIDKNEYHFLLDVRIC